MIINSASRVAKSRFADLIDEMLRSRWSAMRIYRHLCDTYGPGWPHNLSRADLWTRFQIPSPGSIKSYRTKNIGEADVLPESIIASKLNGLDVKIDTIKSLSVLAPALLDRIGRAVEMEQTMGLPLDSTDKAVHSFVEVMDRLIKHLFELGLLKRSAGTTAVQIFEGRKEDEPLDLSSLDDAQLDRLIASLPGGVDAVRSLVQILRAGVSATERSSTGESLQGTSAAPPA